MKQKNDFFEQDDFATSKKASKAAKRSAEKSDSVKNGENKNGKKTILIVVICILVVAIAAAAVFVYITGQQKKALEQEQQEVVETIKNIDVFHEGVTIDGINVTGLTKDQAKEYILAAHTDESVAETYTIVPNAAYSEAKAAADARAAEKDAEQAAAAADATKAAEAVKDTSSEEETGGDVILDENGMPIEQTEEQPTEETTTELLYTVDEANNYTISPDVIVYNYNIDEVLEEAFSLAKEGTYEELIAEVEDIKTNGRAFYTEKTIDVTGAKAAVEQIATAAHIDAVDATVEFNTAYTGEDETVEKFKYVEEINGLDLDVEATYAAMEALAAQGEFGNVEMVTTETPATTTIDDVKGKIVLRGSANTDFSGKRGYAERVWNITKAAGMINGMVIQPGETFSMNDSIGVRTKANGWKMAGALSGGESNVKQYGGGVCQVSTTLYNAVVKGDLEIVYRQAHSEQSSYVDGGLDATINSVGNLIDFKWKNNTNSPVIIVAYTVGYKLYTDVYGEPFNTDEYDEIRLTSKKIGTINPPGEMKYQVVSGKSADYKEVKVKRRSGSKWQSYKNYYKNGELVKTENLDTSVYKAYAGLTLVGALPDASPSATASATKAPESTKTPAATKAPETTKTPEATKAPAATAAPEATKTPEAATVPEPEPGSEGTGETTE